MKVLIGTDIHIQKNKGKYYLSHQVYSILKRYHDAFGTIILYSREYTTLQKEELFDASDIIKESITFERLSSTFNHNTRLENIIKESDLVIGRFHSFAGLKVEKLARKYNKPFLAEVMGDAFDAYWNHGIIGKLIAHYMENSVKRAVGNAQYALYVTEKFLQSKYPCYGISINASNVKIQQVSDNVLKARIERIKNKNDSSIKLLTTAGVDVKSKGQRYVVEALAKLNEMGVKAIYYLAGGGDTDYLYEIAKKNGVENQVVFLGRLNNSDVLSKLEEIDIYIHPSLQEGLPRAVIEAMSRACPCLGARTAGVPELLDEECIFERKSSDAIVRAITRMLESDMSKYAKNNFEKSKEYYSDVLNQRRNAFFEQIKKDIKKGEENENLSNNR